MRRGAAVGIDDDLASGDAGVAVRAADDEAAGRVDVNFGVLVHQARGHDAIDDLLDDVAAHLIVGDVFAVLARDDNRVDANGLTAFVFDRHLRFAVRTEVIEHAVAAGARQTPDELVREHDRQRHQFFGLVARVAEHEALVAGAAGVDAHADVGRLLVQRREHRARVGVESVLRAGVADIPNRGARDFLEVDDRVGRNLAGHDDEAGGHQRLAGDAAFRVLRQNGVEDRVGNLIGNLVGMSFGYGLRRKEMAAVTAHYNALLR